MPVTFIAFEAMAVGTAMPTAVAELDGLAWYGWPFSAFLVASVVGMVIGGGPRAPPRSPPALAWGVGAFPPLVPLARVGAHIGLFLSGPPLPRVCPGPPGGRLD